MILLDTHVLLWWTADQDSRLTAAALEAIDENQRNGKLIVSSVSIWEIAQLLARGRIGLATDLHAWIEDVAILRGVDFISLDNDVAIESTRLPGEFHRDPSDRFLVATSRRLGAPLVTADEKIRSYPHVRTIW